MRMIRSNDLLLQIGGAAILAGLLAGPAMSQPAYDPFADPMDAEDPFAAFDDPTGMQQPPAQDPFDPAFGDPMAPQDPMAQPQQPPPADPFGFGDPGAAPGFDDEDSPFAPGLDPESQPDPFRVVGTTEPSDTGISQLHTFRYIKQRNFLGNDVVVRRRMTLAEAEQFDDTVRAYFLELLNDGEIEQFQPGSGNPNEWAVWLTYAAQVELWSEYATNIVMAGSEVGFERPEISWPGDPAEGDQQQQQALIGGFPGAMGPGGMQPGGQQDSGTDDGFEFSPVPDTRGGQQPQPAFAGGQFGGGFGGGFGGAQGGMVIDPAQMDEQMLEIYQTTWRALRDEEDRQLALIRDLNEQLETRERMRGEYETWKVDQRDQLIEWVADWSRRYDGQTLVIAGVQYELYNTDAEPGAVPRGANLVITDYGITPYDILEEDGTLRGPDLR